MPLGLTSTRLPRKSAVPVALNPGPLKSTASTAFSAAGQSAANLSCSARTVAVALKRPALPANGQSARSPLTNTEPSLTVPRTKAMSSQSMLASGIR